MRINILNFSFKLAFFTYIIHMNLFMNGESSLLPNTLSSLARVLQVTDFSRDLWIPRCTCGLAHQTSRHWVWSSTTLCKTWSRCSAEGGWNKAICNCDLSATISTLHKVFMSQCETWAVGNLLVHFSKIVVVFETKSSTHKRGGTL